MAHAARVRRWEVLGLLRHPDFLKLWLGLTGSLFGMQVSGLALPLTAVLLLGASATEMGVLGAARWLPYLLVGLFAGVWVDRVELVEGNSKLELSRSLATIVGPGAGGWLVQVLSAPIAVAVDSLTFLVDAILVGLIRTPEPRPTGSRASPDVWREIGEGLRWVFGNPYLRPIQATSMSFICANSVWSTVYILFLTRDLKIDPTLLGLIFAAGGPGAVLGSALAGATARRWGLGPQIVISQILAGAAFMLIPVAASLPSAAVPLLMVGSFVSGFMITLGSIGELSLRQGSTPQHLQGRMNATMRSLNWSTVTVGALIGGVLGDSIGLAPTLLVGTLASLLSALWVIFSPVRHVRDVHDLAPSSPTPGSR